ncbi:MAG: outer membrane beta-barrel protein [Gallionella sp.]|nr:outer membrane beta-barrel protein [Gallionella sp.]
MRILNLLVAGLMAVSSIAASADELSPAYAGVRVGTASYGFTGTKNNSGTTTSVYAGYVFGERNDNGIITTKALEVSFITVGKLKDDANILDVSSSIIDLSLIQRANFGAFNMRGGMGLASSKLTYGTSTSSTAQQRVGISANLGAGYNVTKNITVGVDAAFYPMASAIAQTYATNFNLGAAYRF